MDLENFAPFRALVGGGIIGIAASALLLLNGKICGISGITFGIMRPKKEDLLWRVSFIMGLLMGGAFIFQIYPPAAEFMLAASTIQLIAGGLLVGFGTSLGHGCTSGHGICGISRLSRRSLLATFTFIGFGMLSVVLARFFWGVTLG